MVALRKESVDRNLVGCINRTVNMSLSARRAWIEISQSPEKSIQCYPSLSARRAWIEISVFTPTSRRPAGRSPQGERG